MITAIAVIEFFIILILLRIIFFLIDRKYKLEFMLNYYREMYEIVKKKIHKIN